jgi:hypothetical protein
MDSNFFSNFISFFIFFIKTTKSDMATYMTQS